MACSGSAVENNERGGGGGFQASDDLVPGAVGFAAVRRAEVNLTFGGWCCHFGNVLYSEDGGFTEQWCVKD